MARRRVRAAPRKQVEKAAQEIGAGVYSVALEFLVAGEQDPLPIYVRAPVAYVADMLAVAICEKQGWPPAAIDDVASYVDAGLREYLTSFVEGFDPEHFAKWFAGVRMREAPAAAGGDGWSISRGGSDVSGGGSRSGGPGALSRAADGSAGVGEQDSLVPEAGEAGDPGGAP